MPLMTILGLDLQELEWENPAWLHGLWALPLVVFLILYRGRVAYLDVGHLPLLDRVLRARQQRFRIWRLLLSALLWCLAFAGVLSFLASPFTKHSIPGRGHVLLVVDRSLGSLQQTADQVVHRDHLLEAAKAFAAQMSESGTIAVAAWSDRLATLCTATDDQQTLEKVWDEFPKAQGGRNWELLNVLRTTTSDSDRCVLVTPFAPPESLEGWSLLVPPACAEAQPNGASILGVRRTLDQALEVQVVSRGEPRRLELLSGNEPLSTLGVPASSDPQLLSVPLPAGLRQRARLHLTPSDGFPLDDSAALAFPERSRVSVLLVADAPTPFLDSWLQASRVVDPERSGRVEPPRMDQAIDGLKPDVVILVGIHRDLPLPKSRYLLLGSSAPDLPVTFGEREVQSQVVGRSEALLLRGLDLSQWSIDRVAPTELVGAAEVLIDGSAGPLLARFQTGGVEGIFVATLPDPHHSTLPLLPAFPLLLEASVFALAGQQESPDPVTWPSEGLIRLKEGERPVLRLADGSGHTLEEDSTGMGYRLPPLSGFFHLSGVGTTVRPVALATLDHPGRPGPLLERSSVPAPFPPKEERNPLRSWCLVVAAAALALEMLFFRS